MSKKVKLLLVTIIILASTLRLFYLGSIPSSVNWDEAAMGYDAFSLARTGRDQYGQLFPLTFKSLNDYKPPVYTYAAAPFVLIFGLNTFSVRLPSVFAGIASVIAIYYLVVALFEKHRFRHHLGLTASLFLAVSPWHLQFSRTAFESNLATTFVLIAILLFFRKKVIRASIFFSLSLFTYHAARIISPILFLIVFTPLFKKFPRKQIYFGTAIFLTSILIVVFQSFSGNAQNRFTTINSLNLEENVKKSSRAIVQDVNSNHYFSAIVFHNRRFAFLTYDNFKIIGKNYLSHFPPEFFLKAGSNKIMHAPDFGILYFFELILGIAGLTIYLFRLIDKKNRIVLIWLLFAPIPSALVWGSSSEIRSLLMLPPLIIFSSLGLIKTFSNIKKDFLQFFMFGIFIFIYLFSLGTFFHQYFVHTNYDAANPWFLEKKDAAVYTESVKNKYDKVIVSNTNHHRPYIFWLFYNKYDPETYLKNGGTQSGDFNSFEKFDKYEFKEYRQTDVENNARILIIGYPEDFRPRTLRILDERYKLVKAIKIIKTFTYPDGTTSLQAAENIFTEKSVLR